MDAPLHLNACRRALDRKEPDCVHEVQAAWI
jgi:hypothetical protein